MNKNCSSAIYRRISKPNMNIVDRFICLYFSALDFICFRQSFFSSSIFLILTLYCRNHRVYYVSLGIYRQLGSFINVLSLVFHSFVYNVIHAKENCKKNIFTHYIYSLLTIISRDMMIKRRENVFFLLWLLMKTARISRNMYVNIVRPKNHVINNT